MGKTWVELYDGESVYESDAVSVASDFDFLLEDIKLDYDLNDGDVVVETRTSYNNGVTWGEWVEVGMSHESQFDGDGAILDELLFQYRVTMTTTHLGGKSPTFKSFKIDLQGAYKVINTGDVICKPEIWIRKTKSFGDVKLKNLTNGMVMEFEELNRGEEVYINCEEEDIVSSLPRVYRYDNHNDVYMELDVGENLIAGEGDFEMDIRLQFKTLQG